MQDSTMLLDHERLSDGLKSVIDRALARGTKRSHLERVFRRLTGGPSTRGLYSALMAYVDSRPPIEPTSPQARVLEDAILECARVKPRPKPHRVSERPRDVQREEVL